MANVVTGGRDAARGICMTCSDDDLQAIVDYMLARIRVQCYRLAREYATEAFGQLNHDRFIEKKGRGFYA